MSALPGALPLHPGLRHATAVVSAALTWLARAGTAPVALVAWLGGGLLGGPWLRRHYLGPLWRRSGALRGARVALHQVRETGAVGGGACAGVAPLLRTIELTVRPNPRRTALPWWPADLVLVAPGARPERPEEDEPVGQVVDAWRWTPSGFVALRDEPLRGPQRLRLRVALRPGARQFHVRYYLELLGRAG